MGINLLYDILYAFTQTENNLEQVDAVGTHARK